MSTEPRSAWNNSSLNTRSGLAENPWYDMYGVISSVNDALQVLDDGMVIGDAAGTARARAFAKMGSGDRPRVPVSFVRSGPGGG